MLSDDDIQRVAKMSSSYERLAAIRDYWMPRNLDARVEVRVTDLDEILRELVRVVDLEHNGSLAVRWAPSSAHWSNELRRLFGDDARDGIGALEQRLRDAEDNARKANAQAEHFKREWYLRGDEVERLRQALESIRAYWNGDSNETATLDAIRRDIEEVYLRASRKPDAVALDFRAQYAGNVTARDRILGLCRRYCADVVKGVMRRILDTSERAFLDKIKRLPDGVYRDRSYVESCRPGDRRTPAQGGNDAE